MEGGGEVDPSPLLSLYAACSYGVASMAMVFINKAVLMQYAYSMTLLTLQQLATALLIHFGQVTGYTKFKDINMETAKKLLPVSVFYNANVAFALASLKGVNIPMYIALKRLTPPLAVLVAGFFFGKGRPPLQANSLTFFIILILSLVMGITLNYTMFLCTIVNSALTTTIVGVLKGVGSTTLGFVLLGGVQVHALNVTGLLINTAGGVWYSYAKYQLKRTLRKVISDEEAHQKKDYTPNQ